MYIKTKNFSMLIKKIYNSMRLKEVSIPKISIHICKGVGSKIQRKMCSFGLLHFMPQNYQKLLTKLAQISLSARCGSFDTHIAMVYDILCPMAYVIKCHMTYAIHCCTPCIVAHSSKQSMCVKFDVDTLILYNYTLNT